MSVLMTIPIAVYDLLLAKCDNRSADYKLLKNGLINDGSVLILCPFERADNLILWAERYCPPARSLITVKDESLVVWPALALSSSSSNP